MSKTRNIISGVVCSLLTFSTVVVGQTTQDSSRSVSSDRQINLLVLGDSVMWGQGLKTEHKSWYQVKSWLSTTTGRVVVERVEAHTGAIIEGQDATENLSPLDGEVNVAVPTVNEQVNRSLRSYVDGSKVDLVLVNGCANDVGTRNLLNAAFGTSEVRRVTEVKCGVPFEKLLRKITSSFVNARVIVAGYYPFFSEKTRNNIFLRGLARSFIRSDSGAPPMKTKAMLEGLTANSKAWYEASNQTLAAGVAKVNAELSNPRITFAEIHFLPEHSFGAGKSYLWGFNNSPFKRLLVLLSLGKKQLGTNDERRKQRNSSCDEYHKRQTSDSSDKRSAREIDRQACRYAALGHPNRKGATLYADAITSQLKSATTWLSELGVHARQ